MTEHTIPDGLIKILKYRLLFVHAEKTKRDEKQVARREKKLRRVRRKKERVDALKRRFAGDKHYARVARIHRREKRK